MESVYLETSFISYLVALPSRDVIVAGHQQTTQEWWANRRSEFECSVSQVVIDEASGAIRRRCKNDWRSLLDCRSWKLRRTLKHWRMPSWLLGCFHRMLLATLPMLRWRLYMPSIICGPGIASTWQSADIAENSIGVPESWGIECRSFVRLKN